MDASTTEPTQDVDFISQYMEFTNQTECPTFFHRWTAITVLAAYMGKDIWFNHGHFTLYPNLYTMLIGSPGTKKSSAIKIGAKLVKNAGYKTFAAKKTRQEKFLLDLAEQSISKDIANGGVESTEFQDILDKNLFGDSLEEDADSYLHKPPAECFVAADEFNNFIGINNADFVSILGELWDFEGVYDYKLKNSKSVFIPNPCINILGGNTPTGFSQAFPPETIGQGFFSRLLLIYGEPSGIKYTFPPVPDPEQQQALIDTLHKIKANVQGELKMTPESMTLLDKIYHHWEGIDDIRFEHYANRRLTHLLKLCLVVTAARMGKEIELCDVVYANTILTFTEQLMPKALGEFGKARNSDVTHKIMTLIDAAKEPVLIKDIWKAIHQDLNSRNEMIEMVNNLMVADKLQQVGKGYLPKKSIRGEGIVGATDFSILTPEERNLA